MWLVLCPWKHYEGITKEYVCRTASCWWQEVYSIGWYCFQRLSSCLSLKQPVLSLSFSTRAHAEGVKPGSGRWGGLPRSHIAGNHAEGVELDSERRGGLFRSHIVGNHAEGVEPGSERRGGLCRSHIAGNHETGNSSLTWLSRSKVASVWICLTLLPWPFSVIANIPVYFSSWNLGNIKRKLDGQRNPNWRPQATNNISKERRRKPETTIKMYFVDIYYPFGKVTGVMVPRFRVRAALQRT